MKEKITHLRILNPKLTREQLQNHMGCPPILADAFKVSFDRRTISNRCPNDIANTIADTIKPEHIHRWKFAKEAGLLYETPLRKFARANGFIEIIIEGKKIPTQISLRSKVKEYLEHDKKVQLFAQRLARKSVILDFVSCQEMTDTCEIPKKDEWFKAIHVNAKNFEEET